MGATYGRSAYGDRAGNICGRDLGNIRVRVASCNNDRNTSAGESNNCIVNSRRILLASSVQLHDLCITVVRSSTYRTTKRQQCDTRSTARARCRTNVVQTRDDCRGCGAARRAKNSDSNRACELCHTVLLSSRDTCEPGAMTSLVSCSEAGSDPALTGAATELSL